MMNDFGRDLERLFWWGLIATVAIALVIGLAIGYALAGDRYRVDDVVRVIDGDTAVLRLALGQKVYVHRTVRLKGVCAKESWEPGGKVARAMLAEKLAAHLRLTIKDVGTSFDRMVGVLWTEDGVNLNVEIQQALVGAEVNGGRGTCP